MEEWFQLLKKMDVFSGLSIEEVKPLILESRVHSFQTKETIFVEGEERTHIYVLKTGVILIMKLNEDGEERVINILTEGEIFPHTGFFDERPYPGTAFVKKEAEVLAIPLKAFEKFIEQNPQLSFRIIKMMSKKIYDLQKKLNDYLSLNVEERLLAAIENMNNLSKEGLQLTHQDLANIIGASRETVSRQLKKLEKDKKIRIYKDRIEIV